MCVWGQAVAERGEAPVKPFLPLELLRSGASELGIELTQTQLEQFESFAELLVETNREFNLTRITEPREIVTNHYLDSLTCLQAVEIERGSRLIDIGTGAGFPGIPIKIARPDLNLALLESSRKKAGFVSSAIAELGLEKVEVVCTRAEDAGRETGLREKYDVAVTRALSEMKVLAELCLPLVRVGGCLVAQKSTDVSGLGCPETTGGELDEARAIIGQLGGSLEKVVGVTIPHTDVTRRLVVVRKVRPTPERFPRAYAKISKGKAQRRER